MIKIQFVQIILICSTIFSFGLSTEIFIYNQNMGYIVDHSTISLNPKTESTFYIDGLTENAIPSSVLLESDCIEIASHQFIYNPPTLDKMLNAFIDKKIQLVRYGEDGNIVSTRDGVVLSTKPMIMFDIDGKIVFNPPYDFVFPFIPDEFSDEPRLLCRGVSDSKSCNIDYSYFTPGLDWSANYSITTDGENQGNVEVWFLLKNQTGQEFDEVNLTLVSGDIAFARESGNTPMLKRGIESAQFAGVSAPDYSPQMIKTDDFVTFRLPYRVSIPRNKDIQIKYTDKSNIPVTKSYKFEHELGFRGYQKAHSDDIPVTTEYSLNNDDLGEHSQPGGTVRIYEKSDDTSGPVFVGSGNVSNVRRGGIFTINAGRTHDITATYTINNIESLKTITSLENTIEIVNTKDEAVKIEMIERFPAYLKDWEIRKRSHQFEKTDARTAVFTIMIPANSTETISFTADMEN